MWTSIVPATTGSYVEVLWCGEWNLYMFLGGKEDNAGWGVKSWFRCFLVSEVVEGCELSASRDLYNIESVMPPRLLN